MGWDVKATADSLAQAVPSLPSLPAGEIPIETAASWIVTGIIVIAVAAALTRLVPRVWHAVEDVMFSNWRLALLGSAALLLSFAGGWTTWDGMRNFTGESVLSAMFTFGIHGVMLIVAWLIGESFATGMNQVRGQYGKKVSAPMIALTLLGGGLLLAAAIATVIRLGFSNDQVLYSSMAAGVALLVIALIMLFSRSDVIQPYAQGIRIVAKNGMLWVMFFACMATSVFFSFDSRFNVIFPKDQRERAAEIRTKKQVAEVVADIGETISSRRISEAEHLFESEGWKAYEDQLGKLSKASEGAEAEIESHFTRQMEAHRSSIAAQQERIATATSGQAGLASKKATLTDELSRLKSERPTLAAELATKKSELDGRAKEIDAKRVEAMAEDKGVEGTLKEGKGPVYRQRMEEAGKLKEYYRIGEERVKDAQKRLDTSDTRIAQIERELAGVDGELAKLRGEAETAGLRISAAEASQLGQEGQKVDPARVRAAFERARADFRQTPDASHLGALHQHCVQLYDAMISTAATKDRVRNIDCDPKQATEAASVIFALNTGLKAFEQNCAGGEKQPDTGGVDPLLQFGRRCLQDSGLPSKDSAEMAAKLSFIDLNRDDKAHNFVVTLNAFQDGNRLAYLALAIAIGIDSLIFMAGLFGANAVRSPLSDVPSLKARNSQQLEEIIENALLPDRFENAQLVLEAMEPIKPANGFTAEVVVPTDEAPGRRRVLKVLNAGATIGAVERDPGNAERYLVRPELFEFLSIVAKREFEASPEHADLADLEKTIAVALLPAMGANAETILHYMHPISEDRGFTAEIKLAEVEAEHQRLVRNTLNAGATLKRVQRVEENPRHYFIHKDLYKTLARIRAREFMKGTAVPRLAGPESGARFGGALTPKQAAIADQSREPKPKDERNTIYELYRDQFLDALGLGGGVAVRSLSEESIREAAADSWEALQHHGTKNVRLGHLLREYKRAHQARLELIYQRLHAEAAGDARKLYVLDEVRNSLISAESVLILFPQGGLIGDLIEQLENAAAHDDGQADGEQALVDRLRLVQSGLDRMNPADVNSWRQIEEVLLASDDDDLPQIIRIQTGNDGRGRPH